MTYRLICILFLLLCNLSIANASTAEADDTRTWVSCGQENGNCTIPAHSLNKPVIVRYGANNNYIYFVTEGVEQVPCNNFLGDPSVGAGKACDYTSKDLFGLASQKFPAGIVQENKTQSINWGPTWVRFGIDGKWYYSLISGTAQNARTPEILDCSLGGFSNGFDPAYGQTKQCQWAYSNPPFPDAFQNFEQPCATENGVCNLGVSTATLVRFGAINKPGWGQPANVSKFTYRFVSRAPSSQSIPCTVSAFGTDPWFGQGKQCDFGPLNIPGATALAEGSWQKVGSCAGQSCTDQTYQIQVGTSKTDTSATTDQWGATIKIAVKDKFAIVGGAEVTTEVGASYSKTKTFSEATTHSMSQTLSSKCSLTKGDDELRVYQFGISTTASCVSQGTCSGNTLTSDIFCVSRRNTDPSYNGPVCVPGYCKDNLCLTCNYPSVSK